MKLIDTNIFIYAAGRVHTNKDSSIKTIEEALTEQGKYNVSVEILQELLHVYANQKKADKGIKLVESILRVFPQPFPLTLRDIQKSCVLLKKYPNLKVRDSIHAAVVLNRGLEGIVSYDKDFDMLSEVKRFVPSL
ncbi:MAG: type II toxin-antitoxin system VapC family toxin [Bacillota bacterium]